MILEMMILTVVALMVTKRGAKKRSRGESSSAPLGYDSSRFISLTAEQRYTVAMRKTFIPEDGLHEQYWENLRGRHWENKFLLLPPAGNETIAREFMANAAETYTTSRTPVRGVEVDWSASAINAYYGIPDTPEERHLQQRMDTWIEDKRHERFVDILGKLTDKGSWSTFENGAPRYIPKKLIYKVDRPHYYFANTRFFPSTNNSEVTVERGEIIYALRDGFGFNIGKVIHESIRLAAINRGTKKYCFASLITGLCLQAGVQEQPTDVQGRLGRLLDAKFVARLDREESQKNKKLRATDQEEEHEEHEVHEDTSGPSHVPTAADPQMDDRIAALEAQFAGFHTSFQGLESRVSAMQAEQTAFHSESSAFFAEMRRHFGFGGSGDGAGPSGE